MTTRRVWDRLTGPTGTPYAGRRVAVSPIAPLRDPEQDMTIVGVAETTTDDTGRYEFELRPTDALVPSGGRYAITLEGHLGRLYEFALPSAGPSDVWVGDLLGLPGTGPSGGSGGGGSGGGGAGGRAIAIVRDVTGPGKLGDYWLPGDDQWYPWPGGSAYDLQLPAQAGQYVAAEASIAVLPQEPGSVYIALAVVDASGALVADLDTGDVEPSGKNQSTIGIVGTSPVGDLYRYIRVIDQIDAGWIFGGLLTVRVYVRSWTDTGLGVSVTAHPKTPATFAMEVFDAS